MIVIPCRYNSFRLPGKALKQINGKTMIKRTYERCVLSKIDTIVVTDDDRIVEECKREKIPVEKIDDECKTGTDRVARFAIKNNLKWVINVQGDEPFANVDDILKMKNAIEHGDRREVINGYCEIRSKEKFHSYKIPKMIIQNGKLLYASRNPVPYNNIDFFGYEQVCIYGFWTHLLEQFLDSGKTFYERMEDIEILRFIELNINVKMIEMQGSPLHVDTQEDLKTAIELAKNFDD
tara:strand:- start:67 stop:774 length:708 start_codon:yes stop_codon:yes gene_type:complete